MNYQLFKFALIVMAKLFKHKYLNLLAAIALIAAIAPTTLAQQGGNKTDSEYINSILPQARRIQKKYNIPLDLTLAIARQESGNGEYVIGKGNHFGLRCDSDDCITLEKNGQMISYETCPKVAECFNIFAESINALTGDKTPTTQLLYQNGYATSPTWKKRVDTIRQEVQQTLSEAGIKY